MEGRGDKEVQAEDLCEPGCLWIYPDPSQYFVAEKFEEHQWCISDQADYSSTLQDLHTLSVVVASESDRNEHRDRIVDPSDWIVHRAVDVQHSKSHARRRIRIVQAPNEQHADCLRNQKCQLTQYCR